MTKHRNLSAKKIIDKTFQLVNKYGQEYINFSHISRALNFQAPALYIYFKNRTDLIKQVSIEYFYRVHRHAQLSIVGISGNQAVIKYLEAMREYGIKNIKVNNMAFSHAHSPQIKEALIPITKTLYNLLHNQYSVRECTLKAKALENQITGELVNEDIGILPKNQNDFITNIKNILKQKCKFK